MNVINSSRTSGLLRTISSCPPKRMYLQPSTMRFCKNTDSTLNSQTNSTKGLWEAFQTYLKIIEKVHVSHCSAVDDVLGESLDRKGRSAASVISVCLSAMEVDVPGSVQDVVRFRATLQHAGKSLHGWRYDDGRVPDRDGRRYQQEDKD